MKIKIAHLLYRLDIGGMERFLVGMVNRFKAPDYQHIVICLTNATMAIANEIDACVPIYSLDKQSGQDFSIYKKLYVLLKSEQPDILHSYNLAAMEYQIIAWLAGVTGRVHAERGRNANDPHGKNLKHKILRKLVAPFIDKMICVSKDLRDWVINDIGIKPPKVVLIPSGIDIQKYFPNDAQHELKIIRFIHVARLDPVKNQPLLIKAFAKLLECHSNVQLDLVGDGTERKSLEELVKQLAIADKVIFHGMQNHVIPFMQASQVFVLSSIAEGTPISVLEAMACGLPVIATHVGGLEAMILPKLNGMLVATQDVVALTEAMKYYVEHPQELATQGQAAREFVTENFSLSACDAKYKQVYAEVLD